MLPESHPLKRASFAAALFAALSCQVQAQQAAPASSAAAATSSAAAAADREAAGIKPGAASAETMGVDAVLEKVTPADLARAQALSGGLAGDIMRAYEERMRDGGAVVSTSKQLRRYADSIASEAIQAERDGALEFLGIDPQAQTAVYVFVSYSMPLELLRAYVLDAMWGGATVVFRGAPPDRSLGDFVTKDLRALVYGKSAAANISLDPRLFDSYGITTVPAIVFSQDRSQLSCEGLRPRAVKVADQSFSYHECPPLEPNSFYKMSGAVSTRFALESFAEKGAQGVRPYLAALSKGYAQGSKPPREQQAFSGKWEDIVSPEESARIKQFVKEQGIREEDLLKGDYRQPPAAIPSTPPARPQP